MSSSSSDEVDEALEEMVDQVVDNFIDSMVHAHPNKPTRRAYIERDREPLFVRIVERLSTEVPYFQQRKNAHGRYGLSALQKRTAAIRMLAYGQSGDTYDEYLRLGESTLNDINVLDRSPVFDDILQGRAPKVKFKVNNHTYRMAYYLTDGIYPNWSTFIQSIPLPQGPKAELFAERQESTRKDVERAFGVLQSRFTIVKNPALLSDKEKIGRIMRTCVIFHNMIEDNERGGYTLTDTSEFESGESSRSSKVKRKTSFNIGNMLGIRNEIRDSEKHDRLTADLVENVW
uniref:DDE Tnp4 domain-containing protein n=1 Tax=Brassica oleracea var. oleracea TaxID=109376 RepID=A0A0D3DQY9_BRAOL